MKTIKIFFCWIITLCLAFSLAACKNGSGATNVTLNGTDISEYTAVYDDGNVFAKYCAQNLADYVASVTGAELSVKSDKAKESEHEILIGTTNRPVQMAKEKILLGQNEYVLTAEGSKIVMHGEGYMVGGAASRFVNDLLIPSRRGDKFDVTVEASPEPQLFEFKDPTSAILMIGDGMGFTHIECTENNGVIPEFYASHLPNKGSARTYSFSVFDRSASATDSAASGTALATGYKTKNGVIGLDHAYARVKNVRELAAENGAKTAVLTTDSITGATPAAFLAHTDSRNNTSEIAYQIRELADLNYYGGDLGDDLLSETKEALGVISKDSSSFFIMVEEGYIDKHSHSYDVPRMMQALKRFNEVIAYAIEFTVLHPDTVMIVTADHETGGLKGSPDGYYCSTGSHTNADVPVFALGKTTEALGANIDNIEIAKYIAGVFGQERFGGSSLM